MNSDNKNIGSYGEDLACNFLSKKDHIIMIRNFNTRHGEIDIISRINDIIVFTEVKSRYSKKFGSPSQSITFIKKNTIKKTALYFLYKNNLHNINIRFDVIEVILNYYDNEYYINHFENAF